MVSPYRIGGHLVLVSGPSLNVSEAGAQWKRCSLGSTIQHLLPEAAGTRRRERCGAWESCWGGRLFSAQPSSSSGNGCCGEESEEQFSPFFVIYAGQLWAVKHASSSPLNKRGLQNFMSPALGCGLTPLAAYFSYISARSSAFWLGNH